MAFFILESITDYWRYWGLQRHIKYRFTHRKLLKQAFTHPSLRAENNQRLEFLGDAVLGVVVSEVLFDQFPTLNEGALTQLKIRSVNNENLREVAVDLGLEDYLLVGPGLTNGTHRPEKMYADAVEALIGAIFKDGGFRPAKRFIERFVVRRLDSISSSALDQNPKTQLGNWTAKQGFGYPSYHVVTNTGSANAPNWKVKCSLEEPKVSATAFASSIKQAEALAAGKILKTLGVAADGA